MIERGFLLKLSRTSLELGSKRSQRESELQLHQNKIIMKNTFSLRLCFSLIIVLCTCHVVTAENEIPDDLNQGEITPRLGGVGGVYFLAEPGELIVDVQKQDLNRSRKRTQLRAILVAPDRSVVQELLIPDDGLPRGKTGPAKRIRFSTMVRQKGVYALNVTVSNDRYGTAMYWGFRTNCRKYLIETSRGHRDAAHEEPIVVASPEHAGSLCFLPRRKSFEIDLSGLAKNLDSVSVFDQDDRLVQTMPVNDQGEASCQISADSSRGDEPWRIQLDAFQGTIHIDGVTRWDRRDDYRNLSCWTPERNAWFPLPQYRWLVTPYQRSVYLADGQRAEQTFRIHNNSTQPQTILLELDAPDRQSPSLQSSARQSSVALSQDRVTLRPKTAKEVSVSLSLAEKQQSRTVRLRATPENDPAFSTYATLRVQRGVPAAASTLDMPIMLKAYQHENEQFGYVSAIPSDNQVYFDLENRPYILSRKQLWRRDGGTWIAAELTTAQRTAAVGDGSIIASSTKVAFDQNNDLYVLGRCGKTPVLLHSPDHGVTFTAWAIPGNEDRSRTFDIEQYSGQNVPTGPPPIVRYTRTASDPRLIWRRVHDLDLFLPEKRDGQIVVGQPVAVSKQCIGFSSHSGIPSSVVSKNDRVHVVWGEATAPQTKVPGVPGYAATWNRSTKQLSEPTLVGYGPPANDVHNSPSITIDGEGYLHLLIGTHGKPFPYARSLKPNDTAAGWTAPEPMVDARQTYVGLVTGQDGTLHSVFRMWQTGEPPHPASYHAVLGYSRKLPGEPWSAPVPIVVSPFSEYSVFYHRLTIDRRGRLFLSYDYWSTFWFYRNDHIGSRRMLLTSPDGGDTWKLASDEDWSPLESAR